MMTNINFTLSQALQTQLQQPGVYAYAVTFYGNGGSIAGPTATLVNNGVIGNLSMTNIPASFPSGVVYVVIQQNGNGNLLSQLGTIGNLTPANAQANNYSYQLFEASLTPSPNDQGDISALNTFGFPSSYSVVSNGQPITLGFAPGQTGNGLYTTLGNTQTFTGGGNALALGPATTPNSVYQPSDWTQYLTALQNNTTVQNDITLAVPYNGGTSLQANAMLSQYSIQYVASDPVFGQNFFWLVPNTMNGAGNTDWIYMPATTTTSSAGALLQNIYTQTGPLLVYPDNGSGQPSTTPLPAFPGGSFTPNNADGAVTKYLVAGFDAGYWGGSGSSANPLDSTITDLNKTWNWNVTYAYDATLVSNGIKYSNTLGTGAGTTNGNNRFYDPWAQTIQSQSNAYGYSYTDLVSNGGVNPQITLWDPSLNGGTGGNVAAINIGLYANSDTLTSPTGFRSPPSVYVAPPSGTYTPANTPVAGGTNSLGFSFNFTLGGSLPFAPDGTTPATFRFYAPGDKSADGSGFVSLALPQLTGTNNATQASETSIWNILGIQGGPGNWSWNTAQAGTNPYSQQNGQFTLYNVPVTADGTTGWYQLEFGGTGAKTVYNIYASNTGGVLKNIVIDHGVEVTPGQAGYYTLSFAPGGAMLYSIDTFSPPDTIRGTNGADLLTGTVRADTINGGPGNDSLNGGAGIDTVMSWDPARYFTVKTSVGSSTVTLQDKVGRDGTDTLTGIEQIRLKDLTIDASSLAKTAGASLSQINQVADLYIVGGNRAPDALGLDYWVSKLVDGSMSLSQIAKSVFSTPEMAPIFSPANSDPVFVGLMYQNAFGHAPDAAGLSYWVNLLGTGKLARTDFVTALAAGAQGTDKQILVNKEAVGTHFALTAGLNNANWAKTVESGVTATPGTVTTANAQTDAFAVIANTAATSELVVQIAGIVP